MQSSRGLECFDRQSALGTHARRRNKSRAFPRICSVFRNGRSERGYALLRHAKCPSVLMLPGPHIAWNNNGKHASMASGNWFSGGNDALKQAIAIFRTAQRNYLQLVTGALNISIARRPSSEPAFRIRTLVATGSRRTSRYGHDALQSKASPSLCRMLVFRADMSCEKVT